MPSKQQPPFVTRAHQPTIALKTPSALQNPASIVFSTARPSDDLEEEDYDDDEEEEIEEEGEDGDDEDEDNDEEMEIADDSSPIAAASAAPASAATAATAADDEDESLVRLQTADTLWTWGVPYLKEECRALGLAIYGSKKELVQRLEELYQQLREGPEEEMKRVLRRASKRKKMEAGIYTQRKRNKPSTDTTDTAQAAASSSGAVSTQTQAAASDQPKPKKVRSRKVELGIGRPALVPGPNEAAASAAAHAALSMDPLVGTSLSINVNSDDDSDASNGDGTVPPPPIKRIRGRPRKGIKSPSGLRLLGSPSLGEDETSSVVSDSSGSAVAAAATGPASATPSRPQLTINAQPLQSGADGAGRGRKIKSPDGSILTLASTPQSRAKRSDRNSFDIADCTTWTTTQLRDTLKEMNVPIYGDKATLIKRYNETMLNGGYYERKKRGNVGRKRKHPLPETTASVAQSLTPAAQAAAAAAAVAAAAASGEPPAKKRKTGDSTSKKLFKASSAATPTGSAAASAAPQPAAPVPQPSVASSSDAMKDEDEDEGELRIFEDDDEPMQTAPQTSHVQIEDDEATASDTDDETPAPSSVPAVVAQPLPAEAQPPVQKTKKSRGRPPKYAAALAQGLIQLPPELAGNQAVAAVVQRASSSTTKQPGATKKKSSSKKAKKSLSSSAPVETPAAAVAPVAAPTIALKTTASKTAAIHHPPPTPAPTPASVPTPAVTPVVAKKKPTMPTHGPSKSAMVGQSGLQAPAPHPHPLLGDINPYLSVPPPATDYTVAMQNIPMHRQLLDQANSVQPSINIYSDDMISNVGDYFSNKLTLVQFHRMGIPEATIAQITASQASTSTSTTDGASSAAGTSDKVEAPRGNRHRGRQPAAQQASETEAPLLMCGELKGNLKVYSLPGSEDKLYYEYVNGNYYFERDYGLDGPGLPSKPETPVLSLPSSASGQLAKIEDPALRACILATGLPLGQITSLYAMNCGIRSLNGLQHLTQLQFVDLSNNGQIGSLAPLAALGNSLLEVNLGGNNIGSEELHHLRSLKKLQVLDLSNNRLSDVSVLFGTYSVATEDSDNPDAPSGIKIEASHSFGATGFGTELVVLNLSYNKDLVDISPVLLSPSTARLEELVVNSCSLQTPPAARRYACSESLISLRVAYNQINSVVWLAALSSLREISLRGNLLLSDMGPLVHLYQLFEVNLLDLPILLKEQRFNKKDHKLRAETQEQFTVLEQNRIKHNTMLINQIRAKGVRMLL